MLGEAKISREDIKKKKSQKNFNDKLEFIKMMKL